MNTLFCPNPQCNVPHYRPRKYFVCTSCAWILFREKNKLRLITKKDKKGIKLSHIVEMTAIQFKILNKEEE